MSIDVTPLFRPLQVKGFTLRNRIVMPPMVSKRNIVGPDGLKWYGEHAAGGVGLVIVEATAVNRFGGELTVQNLRGLVQAIHDGGALATIQLFPVTFGRPVKPADLSKQEIRQILDLYRQASRICAEAGFDGVEPHGAHGFILNQFFSPSQNGRKDEFGGTPDNRMRMGLEVVRASRQGLGPDKLLLYRHTPVEDGSYGLEESLVFAGKLVAEGVDILDISPASDRSPADRAQPFRKLGVPVIGVNLMDEVERALEALNEGRADLIAVGRGLIADRFWPQKVKDGRFNEIVRCVRCEEKCFGNLRKGLPIECSQW
jgi:2,4-dienoyl-CoA reductase-like NADH-dependent reductase (Old Yellow Enzyme family)